MSSSSDRDDLIKMFSAMLPKELLIDPKAEAADLEESEHYAKVLNAGMKGKHLTPPKLLMLYMSEDDTLEQIKMQEEMRDRMLADPKFAWAICRLLQSFMERITHDAGAAKAPHVAMVTLPFIGHMFNFNIMLLDPSHSRNKPGEKK